VIVVGSGVQIRPAGGGDAGAVAVLAGELAQSFAFSRPKSDLSFPELLAAADSCLLVAMDGNDCLGYLLGFRHLTFYANGPVGWVEEILVRGEHRGRGVGRALMGAFERWASDRDCVLVALATRRAASFCRALGYQELATCLRKMPETSRQSKPDRRHVSAWAGRGVPVLAGFRSADYGEAEFWPASSSGRRSSGGRAITARSAQMTTGRWMSSGYRAIASTSSPALALISPSSA